MRTEEPAEKGSFVMGQVSKKGSTPVVRVDMRRLAKPRVGFEAYASQLVELARTRPALQPAGFDADETLAEVRAFEAAQQVVADAQKALTLALEHRAQSASNVWRTELRIYRHAQAEAVDDTDVEFGIAGFAAFLRPGHRKAAPVVTTPATPPTPVTPVVTPTSTTA
jgi:hypothetical protein